ncbi:hypothetical protein GGR53DRAFT_181320 [Hypoxylon sp. FL1150]|nr:hypothetical protein GGR53DRAFT_181320 [Hypoxylon sp. FL1150]
MIEDNNDHPSPSTLSPSDRSSLPTTSAVPSKTASPLSQNRDKPAMATDPHPHQHDRDVAEARQEASTTRARHPLDARAGSITLSKPPRKRIPSIDVEEANHPRIQDLRLHTPNTAKSNISESPREMICLCTKAPKVPRPRNAFILYRQHYQGQVAARHPGLANPEISKLIGEQWREQPEDVKESWKRLAEEEKLRHQRQYPDYRYQPRRGGKTANARPLSASGEDPGHCPKCGGRYIATPRTPSTPYSAATPEFARPTSSAMSPYPTPNPRVIETDHLRRGSISSTMSADGPDRRFLKHPTTDEYAMMSPDAKRRRTDMPGFYPPGSPSSMAYVLGEPHYQHPSSMGGHHHQQPSQPGGFGGPASLPRPGMHHYQPGYVAAPQHHVQTRARASTTTSYQQPPSRPGTGFDESLRLPPLQTQVPSSPAAKTSEAAEMARASASGPAASHHHHGGSTGLGISNNGGAVGPAARQPQPQAQPQSHQHQLQPQHVVPLQKYPFLYRFDILQQVTQPLPFQPFRTRGPFIAVETHDSELSRQVARVVRNALAESSDAAGGGRYAVKIWEDETARSAAAQMRMPEEWKGLDELLGPGAGAGVDLDDRQLMVYKARMLKWDLQSLMIERYITGQDKGSSTTATAAAAAATTKGEEGGGGDDNDGGAAKPNTRLPVAIVADGWSLTISERYADLLRVKDAYSARDHWQWLATLWRGNLGADLTIHVARVPEADISCYTKLVSPSVMMLYVPSKNPDEPAATDQPKLDETLRGPMERRLAFEVEEWVRRGSFKVDGQTESA